MKSKTFPVPNFLLGLCHFSAKMAKIVKKWQNQKILVENFFSSESIQNGLKRILKRKSRNRNFFPCKIFFVGQSFFSQNGQNSEKMTKSKKFRRFFCTELIQSVLKLITKFFPWTYSFFAQNDQNSGKMAK